MAATGFTYPPALASFVRVERLLQEAFDIAERITVELREAVKNLDEDHAGGVTTPDDCLPSYADVGVFHSFAGDCRTQLAQLTGRVEAIELEAQRLHLQLSDRGLGYDAGVDG